MNTLTELTAETTDDIIMPPVITAPRQGDDFKIGTGFEALAYRNDDFSGTMDPLVMVDHYKMSKPTFGAHPHAGLSAVSVILEDSEGPFHNRDSLGNNFDIMPGDLYWLKAGSGVIHDESPRPGSNIHGLQVFVNLPAELRKSTPKSLHVKAQDMPRLEGKDYRVRLVLGDSNGRSGQQSPALPMTILDGKVEKAGKFTHQLKGGENAWITLINGEATITVRGKKTSLKAGQAITVSELLTTITTEIHLTNSGKGTSHFVLFAGKPINEAYVQKGPFIMGSEAEIAEIEADYIAGKLGKLND